MSDSNSRLQYLPVSFFSTVMGLVGLTLAWEQAQTLYGIELPVSDALLIFSGLTFAALVLLYALKFAHYSPAVLKEFNHPVAISFFPAITISLILLGTATESVSPSLSKWLWTLGAAGQLGLTVAIMSIWIRHTKFEITHFNPAWFIPVVGNILVPITGVTHAHPEVSWFFFSIGVFYWLVLATIIFYRLFFHPPLPGKLLPTLFILIAPPAVGFLSYYTLTGELDAFARILYYGALFVFLLLLSQLPAFGRLKFFLSWWAYSFPLAALTIATMTMFELTQLTLFYTLGMVLLGLLSLVIGFLVVRTVQAIGNREICVPE